MGLQPDGVIDLVEHIDTAALVPVAKRLQHPLRCLVAAPGDAVPMTVRVLVPQVEFVCVDLELSGSDDPVGRRVGGVHGIDLGGVGGVFELHVHGHEAVAVMDVLVGAMIGARHVVIQVIMVGVDDLMPLGIPVIVVAVFIVTDSEAVFVVVVDGEVERGLAVATIAVDVVVGVDGAFREGEVHVVGVVLPAVAVAVGHNHFVGVAGSELKVQDEGAVAGVGVRQGVVVDARRGVGHAVGGPGVFRGADRHVVGLRVVVGLADVELYDAVAA